MPRLLYIGNMLSSQGKNKTSVETLAVFLKKEGYSIHRASRKKNKIYRLLDMLWHIIKYRHSTEVVLIDTYSTINFWYSVFCAAFCQGLNLRYMPILRGGNLPERLKYNPKLSKFIFHNAEINIAPSAYLLDRFKANGIDNIKLIPNSIDLQQYVFKQRLHFSPKLLWVRAFAEIYQPRLALEVLKELLKEYPGASLSMVGPARDESLEKCKVYAKKHQLPVTFTGKLSKKEWLAYAEDFDIFINTTSVDNTPVSVIEAMALGLPVVSTNVGGLPYLIENGKNGFLVPPDDVEKMHNAVCELLNDEQLTKRLSINGRKMAESFDWQIVKEMWKDVLK